MPIKTGDTFVPQNPDRYVIDVSGAQSNPIRGIYHANNPWSTVAGVDAYLEDGSVDHPHMRKDSFISVPLADGTGLKRTYYQSLINAPSSPDYASGTTLGGVVVEDMSYNWQQRKHFHEFCMQYDKYGPLDPIHYAQNPDEYYFLLWRNDKRQFQRATFDSFLSQIIEGGMTEVVNSGFLSVNDIDPSQADSYAPDLTGDFNGDGSISTADLLIFLTNFGNIVQDPVNPAGMANESFLIMGPPPGQEYLLEETITNYVGGPNPGDGTMINFQGSPPNGSSQTIPNSCYITIPADYTIYTDQPEAFLFGVSQYSIYSDPSDVTPSGWGHTDYIELDEFSFLGEDANFNKAVFVEVIADVPEVPVTDKIFMTLKTTFSRKQGSSYPTRQTISTTKGEPTFGFGGSPYNDPKLYNQQGDWTYLWSSVGGAFDINPVLNPGSYEDIKFRMWVGHPGDGLTDSNEVGPWNYRKYSSQDDGFTNDVDAARILRILGGDNDTKNVRLSIGFYTQHGHIDQIKIKQIKVSLKPLTEI